MADFSEIALFAKNDQEVNFVYFFNSNIFYNRYTGYRKTKCNKKIIFGENWKDFQIKKKLNTCGYL